MQRVEKFEPKRVKVKVKATVIVKVTDSKTYLQSYWQGGDA
jgi:hypothetical protein